MEEVSELLPNDSSIQQIYFPMLDRMVSNRALGVVTSRTWTSFVPFYNLYLASDLSYTYTGPHRCTH